MKNNTCINEYVKKLLATIKEIAESVDIERVSLQY